MSKSKHGINVQCPTCGDREAIHWFNYNHPNCQDCLYYDTTQTVCGVGKCIKHKQYRGQTQYCSSWRVKEND